MEGFRAFVRAAHQRGIKVYLDYVINHSGREHWWFSEAIRSGDNLSATITYSRTIPRRYNRREHSHDQDRRASGYDSGQWFTVSTTGSAILKFALDWSNASQPRLTVTETRNPGSRQSRSFCRECQIPVFRGRCDEKMYHLGADQYELSVEFSSSWGFLIRTSTTEWNNKTKYGAQSQSSARISFGKPFVLYTTTTQVICTTCRCRVLPCSIPISGPTGLPT